MKWRCKHEEGFTLVEILASVVIISIILIGVFNFIIFSNKTAATNNEKLVAIHLAKSTMERIKVAMEEHNRQKKAPEYFPYFDLTNIPVNSEEEFHVGKCASLTERQRQACEELYAPKINDVVYNVKVTVSQHSTEKPEDINLKDDLGNDYEKIIETDLNLINVVVEVSHPDPDKKNMVNSIVEGYIRYESNR